MAPPYTVPQSAHGMAQLEVASCTDPGREPSKQINEDAAFARDTQYGHLAVVCDGMGGHVGGREASHLAVETIFRVFDETPPGAAPRDVLAHAVKAANHAVYSRGQSTPELSKMGSTCVAVLTHAGGSEVAHVGDSRVYLITQGQAYQVTKDHSLVQRLVDANMLTPEEASNHPNANQITNALGMRADVDVELRPQPFPHTPGDTFLLCSDGLSDELGPADFLHILAPYPPLEVAARQLVDLANARGGHDNITVVLVRVPGGAPFAPPSAAPGSGRVNTPVATPLAFPVPGMPNGSAAPTATMDMAAAAAGPTPTAPLAPAYVPPPAYASAPTPGYASAPTPAEPQERKGKGGLIVAIVVVLLLVVGGVLAAMHFRGSPPSESSQGSSSTESEPSESASTKKPAKPPKPKPTTTATETEAPADSTAKKPPVQPTGAPVPTTTTTTTEPTTKATELAPEPTTKLGAPP
jgi:protein phosphatase